MPVKQFEERCGLANGYVKSMRRGFGYKKLDAVLSTFTDLNRDWLMYGEGEMLNTGKAKEGQLELYQTYLLPLSAMGGSLSDFMDSDKSDCEKIISPIQGIDFAITVYGDDMTPECPTGSLLLLKRINPDIFIEWGKVYALDTDNGIIVRDVRQSDKEGYISCHALNPKYADFDVALVDVKSVYKVMLNVAMK